MFQLYVALTFAYGGRSWGLLPLIFLNYFQILFFILYFLDFSFFNFLQYWVLSWEVNSSSTTKKKPNWVIIDGSHHKVAVSVHMKTTSLTLGGWGKVEGQHDEACRSQTASKERLPIQMPSLSFCFSFVVQDLHMAVAIIRYQTFSAPKVRLWVWG